MVVLTADNNELGFFPSLDPFSQGLSSHSVHDSDSPWFYFGSEEAKVFSSELDLFQGSESNEPNPCVQDNDEHLRDYQLPDTVDDLPLFDVHSVLSDVAAPNPTVSYCHYVSQ